jgi:HlyD family secretion protein
MFFFERKISLAAGFVLCVPILVPGCGSSRRPKETGSITALAAQTPLGVTGLGRVVPGQRVIRVAPASPIAGAIGVVQTLRVQRGDRVRKGQVLAVLQGHEAAAAAVTQAEREVDLASTLLDQARNGAKPGPMDALKLHAGAARVGLQKADPVAIYQSLLEVARANWNKAAADLGLSVIRAPMAGEVLAINAYPGEAIGPDGLLDLGDTEHMMVEAEVDILDIAQVRTGGRVQISGEGLPGTVTGQVEEIFRSVTANGVMDPQPLANADRRVVRVRVRPDRPQPFQRLVNAVVRLRFLP